ncbi:hypothetical protein ACJX0J_041488, partial [Zea mays]
GAKKRQKKMTTKRSKVVPKGTSLPTVEKTSLVVMTSKDWEAVASETKETKAGKIVRLELEINYSLPDSEEEDATPSATVVAEENVGSSKPITAEDNGKKPAELEDAKKAIEDDAPLGEGPFDQEFGGRKYRVHQAVGKVMGAKQLAEAIGFAKQLGYCWGPILPKVTKTLVRHNQKVLQ